MACILGVRWGSCQVVAGDRAVWLVRARLQRLQGGWGCLALCSGLLCCGYGAGPGGHRVVDGPDADRVGLVPARGGHAGKAAALLRPPVSAGRGGRHLLCAARRADRPGVGGADPGRLHFQRQGVQPVHPAPHPRGRAARRPAPGRGEDRQGPHLPQRPRPGSDRPGVGAVFGRAGSAAGRAQAGRDLAAVPALVPHRQGPQGLHRGLRASGPRRTGYASSSATGPG